MGDALQIFKLIEKEKQRQVKGIELIASENYVSQNVINAMGSILTNKYAEGYPGKRYYGGCEVVDEVENMAIENAQRIFGCEYVNVQPHSGSQANASVLFSLLKPGDAILGLDLNMGGHLTHGSPVSFSGKQYKAFFYGLHKETGLIDYDHMEKTAIQEKPKVIICGASSYSRDWDYARIRSVADKIGAIVMADIAHPAGLVAKGLLKNPFQHCHIVTTTTHKTLRGPRGGMIMMGKDFDNPLGLMTPKGKPRPMSALINSAVFPGNQGGPLMHVIAAKAIAFAEVSTPAFETYAKQIIKNASLLASELQKYGFTIVSGGTENHIVLIDLHSKNITGKDAENLLGKVDITVNKNMVPFDDQPAMTTSGIRLGTSAITSRGLVEHDIKKIAHFIHQTVENRNDEASLDEIRRTINDMMSSFTIYPTV